VGKPPAHPGIIQQFPHDVNYGLVYRIGSKGADSIRIFFEEAWQAGPMWYTIMGRCVYIYTHLLLILNHAILPRVGRGLLHFIDRPVGAHPSLGPTLSSPGLYPIGYVLGGYLYPIGYI